MAKSHPKVTSFRSIIELWRPESGSRGAAFAAFVKDVASVLPEGVTPPTASAVDKWWQRDSIPAEWWSFVLKTKPARRAGLTSEKMVAFAAAERLGECA